MARGVPREGAPTGGGCGWLESLLIDIEAVAGVEWEVLGLRWGVALSARNWTGVLIPMSYKSLPSLACLSPCTPLRLGSLLVNTGPTSR